MEQAETLYKPSPPLQTRFRDLHVHDLKRLTLDDRGLLAGSPCDAELPAGWGR